MKPSNGPKKIKVLHLITRLEPGGAQKNTLYTAGHLDPERFEVVLACGPGEKMDEKGGMYAEARALASREPPVRLRIVPDLARQIRPHRDLLSYFKICNLLMEERPDLIHTHSAKAGILGRFAARRVGVPAIHTFHGFAFERDDRSAWLYQLLERRAAEVSDRLVFVSKANQEEAKARRIGDPSKYLLIRSGVKLADFPARIESKEKKKQSIGARMHHPLIVMVGNYKRQKRPMDFLDVAKRVTGKSPEVNFAFIGNGGGAYATRVESRRTFLGLDKHVHLLGVRKDVPEILAAADIFILTSFWEGLPRALVEAMKSGLPCVCYAVDGVKDILKDGINGFAIRPGDTEGMAEKICLLLKDKNLREKMGRAAAETIGPEFDIDHMVRQQEGLYEQLLKEREAAAPC